MNNKELQLLCTDCWEIVKQVGQFIKSERGKVTTNQIEEKGLNSLVSYVDKTAETMLTEQLGKRLPNSTFLTEEETVEQKTGKFRWIIDPLDGTTNFLHQLPYYGVSVALEIDGKISIGIVYEPNKDEMFYAWKNGGSFMNGQSIQVSETEKLKDSLIATGFPYHDFSLEKPYFEAFNVFMKNSRGIRRFGAAAVDLAYVACGRFDVFYEYGLNAWDIAAGSLIVEEAGGRILDFKGEKNFLFGREIIASNPLLSAEVLQVIKKPFHESQ